MTLAGMTVLLAEDNPTNQMVAMQMLQALGAETTLAVDGAEALALLESRRFDVALIDLEMPKLSGLDVIRRLRAADGPASRTTMIVLTAHTGKDQMAELLEAGAQGVMTKPILSIARFGEEIAAHLAGGAPDTAPRIDLAAFDRLRTSFEGDRRAEFLSRLAEDIAAARETLSGAIAGRDLRAIRAVSHDLVSLAGTMGAIRLQELAHRLISAGDAGNDWALDADGAALLEEVGRVLDFVRRA